MEKSTTPACLGFFKRANLLRPADVGVLKAIGECELNGFVSLKPPTQCNEERRQCERVHAYERRGEVGGNNCEQGIEGWEADLNVQGPGGAERREGSCGRFIVGGEEDTECSKDCGGAAQEEGSVEQEGSVEEGVGAQEDGSGVHQTNTYEAARNKRVAKVQERLQLLLSAKTSMWVGPICGFWLFSVSSSLEL